MDNVAKGCRSQVKVKKRFCHLPWGQGQKAKVKVRGQGQYQWSRSRSKSEFNLNIKDKNQMSGSYQLGLARWVPKFWSTYQYLIHAILYTIPQKKCNFDLPFCVGPLAFWPWSGPSRLHSSPNEMQATFLYGKECIVYYTCTTSIYQIKIVIMDLSNGSSWAMSALH